MGKVYMSEESSAPSTPASGKAVIYPKTDGLIYAKNDAGLESLLTAAHKTTQATTSGSSVDFTSIPAGTKRITVTFDGVSTNGTAGIGVRLGTGGSPETSGYKAGAMGISSAGTAFMVASTTSFATTGFTSAAALLYGALVFTLMDASTNTWVCHGDLYVDDTTDYNEALAGSKSLAGTLDMIRILCGGADTFDAGSVNIMFE